MKGLRDACRQLGMDFTQAFCGPGQHLFLFLFLKLWPEGSGALLPPLGLECGQ